MGVKDGMIAQTAFTGSTGRTPETHAEPPEDERRVNGILQVSGNVLRSSASVAMCRPLPSLYPLSRPR